MKTMDHCRECEENGTEFCEAQEREPRCEASDDGEHDWTSEGCGGARENPGVWNKGGTTYVFVRRCRACGMAEHETHYGLQRDPDQCDTRKYERDAYDADPSGDE